MSDPLISIIMRSYNEAWALRETLPALKAQEYKNWELIVIDSGSTDGSPDLIRAANPAHFIEIASKDYNPSRVMNHGMRLAKSDRCLFLNADATPQGDNWLRTLADALLDPKNAAVFSRQIPRPDCQAVYAADYDRCFGPNRDSVNWDHFFSMVSSGLRRDVWEKRGFREDLQYAEDDEYTRWCVKEGYHIKYVEESVVMHSHNYTAPQFYKRCFGDARSMASTWPGKESDFNWPRMVLLPWVLDLRRDALWCAKHHRLSELPHAARMRWAQRRGKLDGYRQGWKDYRS